MTNIKTPRDAFEAYGFVGTEAYNMELTLAASEALQPKKFEPAGPNQWDFVTPSDFGPEEDYMVTDHTDSFGNDCVVVWPCSDAAVQWCYAKLPEHTPRYDSKGFIIEKMYWPTVEHAMKRDRLMSRKEFEDAMDEAHIARMQQEMDR